MIVSTCNVHTKAPQNWWLLTKYHISHRIASDIGNLFRPPGFGSISTYTAVDGVLRKLILAALLGILSHTVFRFRRKKYSRERV